MCSLPSSFGLDLGSGSSTILPSSWGWSSVTEYLRSIQEALSSIPTTKTITKTEMTKNKPSQTEAAVWKVPGPPAVCEWNPVRRRLSVHHLELWDYTPLKAVAPHLEETAPHLAFRRPGFFQSSPQTLWSWTGLPQAQLLCVWGGAGSLSICLTQEQRGKTEDTSYIWNFNSRVLSISMLCTPPQYWKHTYTKETILFIWNSILCRCPKWDRPSYIGTSLYIASVF